MELTERAPYEDLEYNETKDIFYTFVVLCCLLKNKKMPLQNAFILSLTDSTFNTVLKDMLGIENDKEMVRAVISVEPQILKSKNATAALRKFNFNR